tara:strand:- start:356 stop:766 length:411 start_codon:yes stop_codon:yes gene_type:complete
MKKQKATHRYFITLTPRGGATANPETEAKKFSIALSNQLGKPIYVDGACWDKTCDARKNTHIHLIVGCKSEIKKSVVKSAWHRGIIHFQPYDDCLDGFTYIFKGSATKLPHIPITWKKPNGNVFHPSCKRLARFSK